MTLSTGRYGKGLTRTQEEVLAFIGEFWRQHGYPPATREVRNATRVTSTSVAVYTYRSLRTLGLIVYEDRVGRSVRLTLAGWAHIGFAPMDLHAVIRELEGVIEQKDVRIAELEARGERDPLLEVIGSR